MIELKLDLKKKWMTLQECAIGDDERRWLSDEDDKANLKKTGPLNK